MSLPGPAIAQARAAPMAPPSRPAAPRARSLRVMALVLGLGALFLLALSVGSTPVPPAQTLSALLGPVGTLLGLPAVDPAVQAIVRDLRLPRALLAAAVGAILAVVGGLLQTVTRNDLADPFLFGLSSGAAAGAVAVIALTGEALGAWTLPLASFAGGVVAAGSVLCLAERSAGHGAERIVLAGLAISFLFGALTHVLVFMGDQRAAHSVLFWSLGGLGLAQWDRLPLVAVGLLATAVFVLRRHRALDALLAGDDTAHSLGIDPQRLRRQAFVVAAFATACCVALAGVIGFVGLMVPHLAGRLSGMLHGARLPMAALLGALLLLASDLVARLLLAPQELPVGIVTASIGAGFVILMLLRRG